MQRHRYGVTVYGMAPLQAVRVCRVGGVVQAQLVFWHVGEVMLDPESAVVGWHE